MQISRRFGFFICAGLLSAALHGCGGSSSKDTIPSTVSIFYEHSLIFRNHTTFTMGYNAFGQLGDGTLTRREIATPVPGMTGMVKGVAGNEHTMVTNGSAVYSWGYNLFGQLGNSEASTSYPDAYKSSPVQVNFPETITSVTDIAAGGYHSLAAADGKLYAWGYNGNRQLGNSSTTNAKTPVHVAVGHEGEDLSLLSVKEVAAGGTHSLALFDNGDVYAWGNNKYAQVGFSEPGFSTYSSAYSSPRKVTISGATGKIDQIAALSSASLALEVQRDVDNNIIGQTLWGWGFNNSGELGADIALQKSSATPVKVFQTPAIADASGFVVKKIATGMNHILLLVGPRDTVANDGSWYVQAIGLNSAGQLGNDTTTSSIEFIRTLDSGGALMTNVSDIAAYGKSSFALIGGVWYGWGNNSLGQLGNPVQKDTIAFYELPVTVKFQ
ncbi:RCC1 domain-containing protein [Geomonas edaphica]|uniref:RCC1 domain-containing protein n=1 Tax=Geomonas edaphica TaxID=2570226 RepID=UPI0010A84DB8|nr:chromosome condensation regulator RCC1 [Geomonas edaphica]